MPVKKNGTFVLKNAFDADRTDDNEKKCKEWLEKYGLKS